MKYTQSQFSNGVFRCFWDFCWGVSSWQWRFYKRCYSGSISRLIITVIHQHCFYLYLHSSLCQNMCACKRIFLRIGLRKFNNWALSHYNCDYASLLWFIPERWLCPGRLILRSRLTEAKQSNVLSFTAIISLDDKIKALMEKIIIHILVLINKMYDIIQSVISDTTFLVWWYHSAENVFYLWSMAI